MCPEWDTLTRRKWNFSVPLTTLLCNLGIDLENILPKIGVIYRRWETCWRFIVPFMARDAG